MNFITGNKDYDFDKTRKIPLLSEVFDAVKDEELHGDVFKRKLVFFYSSVTAVHDFLLENAYRVLNISVNEG